MIFVPTIPAVVTQICPLHPFGLTAGMDRDRSNQLADELEAEETAKRSSW